VIAATVAQLAEQRFCNLTSTRPTGSKTRVRGAHFPGYFPRLIDSAIAPALAKAQASKCIETRPRPAGITA
jgi:hypothetical protein